MEPTKEFVDQLYRDDVLRARAMDPGFKLFAGAELFEYACRITLDGIRHQFPDADEQRVQELLRERLALLRRLEEVG